MSALTIACNGDNLDSSYKIYNKTLLILCKLSDIEKFKVLVLGGHLIYYDTYDETTFVHEIVKNNMYDFFEVIENLFENKKIDINIVDINGNTPLHFALSTLNFRMVSLLLRNGANITYFNYYGFSPIYYMINNDYFIQNNNEIFEYNVLYTQMFYLIISYGFDVNSIIDIKNNTIYHYLLYSNKISLIKYLLGNNRFSLSIKNVEGITALDIGKFNKNINITNILVEHYMSK